LESSSAFTIEKSRSTYSILADEYYDTARHPTCANFRWAGLRILDQWLTRFASKDDRILEIGAGKSVAAPLLHRMKRPLDQLVLTDESIEMLAHSEAWRLSGVVLKRAPAHDVPYPDQAFKVIISCLGDPYNQEPFWREASRLLAPGGHLFYITPAWEWASQFRDPDNPKDMEWSEFENREGSKILLPSYIYPPEKQKAFFKANNLEVVAQKSIHYSELSGLQISPKLMVNHHSSDLPIVTGFASRRI